MRRARRGSRFILITIVFLVYSALLVYSDVQTVPIDVASEEAVLPGEILHTSPNPRFTNDDDELRSTPDTAMDFTSEESSSSIMDSGSTVPTEVKPTGHPTWRPRRENCTPPAIEQFPRPLMGPYARRHGGLVLHVTVAIFTFFGLAIVCDDYFVSSLDRICEELKLSPDVAGATFMAAGSSAPELATVVIGVFFAKDDIGVSGVIGSAVFNIMFVISVCALCSGTVSHLNWWPLVRDCFFYAISILVMLFTIFDETIAWGEALVMLLMYVVYCIVLHFNSSLERWAHSLKLPIKLPTKEEQSALVTYKNIPEDQLKVANYTSPDIEPIQQPPPLHEQGYNASYTDPNAAWDPNASWDADTGSQAPVYGQPAYNQPSYNQPSYNQPSHGWDNPGMQGWNETGDVDNVVPTKTEQTKQNEPKQAVASTTGVQLVGDFYRPARSTELSNPLLKPTEGGILPKISWAVVYPIHYMCRLTMPDCKTEKYKNWYPFTFFMSMIWISFYSYFMVWMITIIGTTLGIPDTVMGLTFVAAGVSVPDALSSIAVIKEGYGDMAVSNAVGSNVFDILICLGLPWFIQTAIIKPGSHVNVISKGLTYSTLSLLSTVIFLLVATHLNGWKLDKRLGIILMIWYIFFITLAALYELNIFGQLNPPECKSLF